jgi:PKD repeat protein
MIQEKAMGKTSALARRMASMGTVAALMLAGLVVTTAIAPAASADVSATLSPIAQPAANNVTADALPTVQVDGIVWSQAVVGNTVYAGGKFGNARPSGASAGTNNTVRNNLLAYDITTGALITSFAPDLNGQVLSVAASPDGKYLYVGGDFTQANGQTRSRIAGYNLSTGALLPSFIPLAQTTVRSVVATNSSVYFGGDFKTVNGVVRQYLAAADRTSGALSAWAPTADAPVTAMVMTPDASKLIVGGRFANVNATPALGLAAVSPSTGALLPWNAGNTVQNYGSQADITSLSTDGSAIYGTGYVFGAPGNLEGTFSADLATGNINWVEDCHGDTYDAFPVNGIVYTVSHAHYCGNIGGFPQTSPQWTFHHALAFTANATGTIGNDPYGYYNWAGTKSPSLINWFPDLTTGTISGQSQAVWSIKGNASYVVLGGEFPSVNGVAQAGLVRFAVKPIAPGLQGPMLSGPKFKSTLVPLSATTMRVSWPTNWDRDDLTLTYKVVRNGNTATPAFTSTVASPFWGPTMGFIDTGLKPSTSYYYKLYATDAAGHTAVGDPITVVTPATGTGASTYAQRVTADGAAPYWPMNEAAGPTFIDHVGFNDARAGAGVTWGTSGAVSGDTAASFNGSSTASAATATAVQAPDVFTGTAWFRAASTMTSGGKILGFGNTQAGTSASYDRHIYMDNAGHIIFGVFNNQVSTLVSSSTYNDGQWHQVAASLGANGMVLSIDGLKVGSRADVTSGQNYQGFWRVGGDNLGGWTNQPANNFFAGDIDEVAIFPTVLSKQTVQAQYVASGRSPNLPTAPADGYGSTVYNNNPDLYWRLSDTSGSTASDSSTNLDNGIYYGGATLGAPGLPTLGGNTAVQFDGSSGMVSSTMAFNNPTTYSEEAWFKTATNVGGKLIGFGNIQDGLSSGYDRHIYMQDNGQLVFGTYTNQTNTITSGSAYNDNQWHHVVATQGAPDGMRLYVDGALVGTNPQTSAQDYTGYWKVGGDRTWSSSSPYFNGTIDEVAVYPTVLTASQVATDYSLGSPAAANKAPVAAFTTNVANRVVTFDGTTSTDSDGTIASYAWDYGDGITGTGVKPAAHTFTADGSYTVKLTVTDDQGTTNAAQQTIQVAANRPPVAAFVTEVANLAATFDASTSSDPDGSIVSYAWAFGDGQTGTGKTSSHTYATAGTYQVKLTVTDNQGATATSMQNVVATAPPNQPPTSSFTFTAANRAVTFNGGASSDSDGSIASYAWDFGDSTTASSATPSHTYSVDGTYTVKLTVTDDKGATGSSSQAVTVAANQAPVASYTTTLANLSATFDASGSTDADGAVASYAWAFGDGQTGTGKTPSHTYATAGAYQVKLTVTDNQGATGTVTTSVTIAAAPNQPPTSSFTFTAANRAVTFNGGASSDSDGSIASYAWDFGDSTTASSATPSHTYSVDGTYTVKLTVTDDKGATGSSSQAVTVAANQAPVASYTTTLANLSATFDASGSTDADGAVASYAWAFGDGQTGTGKTPSHTYATAGAYQVKLTVTDNQGATGTVTTPVTVAMAANQPPVADFSGAVTNLSVAFDASASSDPDGSVASYAWAYGDGATGTGKTSSHAYTAAGTYQVKLTVTDNQGGSTSITKPVTVTVAAPTVYAADTFGRTLTGQWGTADKGGAWTVGAPSLYSVSGSAGKINLNAAGVGPLAYLNSVSASNVNYSADVSINVAATGGGVYQTLIARHSGTSDYRAKAVIGSNGAATLILTKLVSGTETTLKSVTVTGLTYTAGDVLHVRFVLTGSGTTALSAKAWKGVNEPTAYQATTTDTTASLQGVGSIGWQSYLSGSSTNAPVISTVDNISVGSPN